MIELSRITGSRIAEEVTSFGIADWHSVMGQVGAVTEAETSFAGAGSGWP